MPDDLWSPINRAKAVLLPLVGMSEAEIDAFCSHPPGDAEFFKTLCALESAITVLAEAIQAMRRAAGQFDGRDDRQIFNGLQNSGGDQAAFSWIDRCFEADTARDRLVQLLVRVSAVAKFRDIDATPILMLAGWDECNNRDVRLAAKQWIVRLAGTLSVARERNAQTPEVAAADTGGDGAAASTLDPIAVAVTMKVNNPSLSIRKVAAAVGIPHSTLAKHPLWKASADRLKQVGAGRIRQGSKSETGDVDTADG